MPTVVLPTSLTSRAGGPSRLGVEGATAGEVLEALELQQPALKGWVLDERGYSGVLQVATFHPGYRFADTPLDALGNYTNRAPFPTLHLLRESSIGRAVAEFGDTDAIPRQNVATLEALGRERVEAFFASLRS